MTPEAAGITVLAPPERSPIVGTTVLFGALFLSAVLLRVGLDAELPTDERLIVVALAASTCPTGTYTLAAKSFDWDG